MLIFRHCLLAVDYRKQPSSVTPEARTLPAGRGDEARHPGGLAADRDCPGDRPTLVRFPYAGADFLSIINWLEDSSRGRSSTGCIALDCAL